MADRVMKPKAVVLDIDDVIDDFCGGLCWVHNLINNTHVSANDIRDWNFETLKVRDKNGNEVIGSDLRKTFEYWEEHGLYADLKLLPGVYDAIKRINEEAGSDFKTRKIKQLSRKYNIQFFADDKYSTVEHVAENTNVNTVCLIETASTKDLPTIEGDAENRLVQNEDIQVNA